MPNKLILSCALIAGLLSPAWAEDPPGDALLEFLAQLPASPQGHVQWPAELTGTTPSSGEDHENP